jgi:hypothetical protein
MFVMTEIFEREANFEKYWQECVMQRQYRTQASAPVGGVLHSGIHRVRGAEKRATR